MAIPVFFASMSGAIVASLTSFVMSKSGAILVGLGLTFTGVKGLESLIGFVVSDLQSIQAGLSAASSGGGGDPLDIGGKLLQFAAFAGLFDGVNIVISGYMAYASMLGLRVALARLR